SGLELGRISPAAPAMRVGGTVALDVRGLMADVRRVTIDLAQVSIDEYQVPSLHLESEVGPEQVRIERLDLPYLDGELDVRGRIGFDGDARLDVRARIPNLAQEPNLRGLVPALAGSLRADLELRHRAEPEPWVSAQGAVTWTNARLATVRAGRLHAEGTVRGALAQPRADVRLGARDLRMNDLALGDVRLSAEGGPRSYAVRLAMDAPGERRLRLAGRVRAEGEGYVLDASRLAVGIPGHAWRGRIGPVIFTPDEQVRVDQLLLADGDERLELEGSYGLGRKPKVDVEASLQRIDLALLDAIPGMDAMQMRGRVDLTATVRGDAEMPEVTVEGAWSDGSAKGVPIDAVVAYALWQPEVGHLASDIDVDLGEGYGSASLRVEGELDPPVRDVEEALMGGRYQTELTLDSLSAAIARAVAPDAVPEGLEGHLSGSAIASGTPREFSLGLTLTAQGLVVAEYGPVDVHLTATSDEGMTRGRVEVDQGDRALFRAWGGAAMGVPELARNPESVAARLKDEPWELHAEVPPLRLDELPGWAGVDLPARAWLRASVGHPADRPAEAHVRADVTWLEDLAGASPIGGGCAEGAKPRLSLQADVKGGRAEAELRGRMHGKQVLRARMEAAAHLNEWLEGELPSGPPPVKARARIVEADLRGVPVACEYASGTLSAELMATDLFTDSPSLELDAHAPDLVAMESPPMALDVNATAGTEQLRADIRLGGRRTEQGARITASLPIAWGGENVVPALREEEPMRADLRFDMTPLGPLLAPVPGIGYASGAIDGRVRVEGAGRDVRFDGALSLHDTSLSLLAAGNRLDDVRGKVIFDDQTIRLDRLHARDRDGRVTLDGRFVMEGLSPREGQVQIDAREFPVRNAGVVIARLTTKAGVDMRFGEAEARTRVGIDEMRVKLESVSPPEVQDLDSHPDVRVAGQPSQQPRAPVAEEEEEDVYPLVIQVRSREPFWVRREDLAAQLEADLTVRVAETTQISGRVELIRGFFELVGKRFELDEGHIQFTGGDEVDPVVDLEATYDLGAGEELTVNITGHIQDPQLNFSSTTGEVNNIGDAIALLMGGRRGGATEQGVEQQATSVLAGVTAGILTTTLRRELGDLFPVITVESGDRFGAGMLRAGLSAERLIPGFLQDVVRSAYVEGFVGSGGEDRGAQPQGSDTRAGFLVELRWPYDMTTTATFEPPAAWSLDLLWEP
ncbi:MAG: translocation/assembly module TamB domain-containing protein, partial [Myxococcota bacterium]